MADGIALINTETGDAWVFQFFPSQLSSDDQANWTPQDVSVGTKPLIYSNRDPQRIEIPEVLLDSTDTGKSLTEEIEQLRSLMRETINHTPPLLYLICGDWQQRVVMERLRVERKLFNSDGQPIRAYLNMSFIEFRQVERVTVNISDSIGNF
ncbi:MAG: hypothetical protein AUG51_07355 [Acidobacteria bacterium 13_1_20CM_3_53_8]|nr:MAG: hypothetical protein AUG51_07355 [Acidobacteria bacterium 13_1_20CM_3_53_8]